MAGNDTAALVVALSAQLTKFEKDLREAGGLADKHAKHIEDRFAHLNLGAGGLEELISGLRKVAEFGGVTELLAKILELGAAVAEIGEKSRALGVTTDQFQAFRFAAVSTGSSLEQADRFLEQFSRHSAEAAKGSGDLYNFLRSNGIAAREFAKLPLNDQLARYADLVKNDATATQRLGDTMMIGGRNAASLVNALEGGSAGLKRFADDAQTMGGIIDKDLIERAEHLEKQWRKTKLQMQVTAEELAIPLWTDFNKTLETTVREATAIYNAIKSVFDFIGEKGNSALKGLGLPTFHKPDEPATFAERFSFNQGGEEEKGTGTTKHFDEQAEAFRKLIDAQEGRIKLLQSEQQGIGLTVQAQTFLTEKVKLETEARKALNMTEKDNFSPALQAKIDAEAQKIANVTGHLDELKRHWKGVQEAAQFAGDEFIGVMDGLRDGTMDAASAMKHLTSAIIHALEQAALLGTGPLASLFGTQTAVTGGTGGLIGALISGFRASGGPVSGGQPYIVGESGPELFVPTNSGNIVPNSITGSMGGQTIAMSFSIDARGADQAAVNRIEASQRQLMQNLPRIISSVAKQQSTRGVRA